MFDAVLERTRAELVDEPFCLLPELQFAWLAACRLTAPSSRYDLKSALSVIIGERSSGKSMLVRRALRQQPRRAQRATVAILQPEDFDTEEARLFWHQTSTPPADLQAVVLENLDEWNGLEEISDRLAHVFDIWSHMGLRIAVTLSKSPSAVAGLSPRLVSRLHGGLLARIPGLAAESRHVYLKWAAELQPLSLSDDVLLWLLSQSKGTVGSLREQIDRLAMAYPPPARVTELAELQQLLASQQEPRLSLSAIAQEVATEFGISTQELRTSTRVQSCRIPRQCAMWLAHDIGGWPMTKIGHYFGRRTHAAVSYNCRKLQDEVALVPSLRQRLEHLRTRLQKQLWSDCG
ncbi:hypothetical protein GC163_06295 [bacterium]|nr:hypothetical protein [bacterium]